MTNIQRCGGCTVICSSMLTASMNCVLLNRCSVFILEKDMFYDRHTSTVRLVRPVQASEQTPPRRIGEDNLVPYMVRSGEMETDLTMVTKARLRPS